MAHSAYRIVPLVVVAPAGLEPGQDGNAAAPHPESLQQVKDNQDQCYYYRVQGEQHRRRLVDALVALHVACIQFDGALMRFHPPFGAAQWQRMRLFWDERVAQAEAGRRVVLLALPAAASVPAPVPVPGAGADVNAGGGGVGGVGLGAGDGASEHQGSGNHDANDNDVNAGIDIAGVVELATPDTDTGPFRADVEMLMVSPDHRRAGLGKRLMAAVEDAGRQRGRTLLDPSPRSASTLPWGTPSSAPCPTTASRPWTDSSWTGCTFTRT